MTNDNAPSAAAIVADAEFFRDMRWLIKQLERLANKNDIVDMLIRACIDHGMDRSKRIEAAITHLGFDPVHVRIRLHHGRLDGSWTRDGEARYHAAETETASIDVPRTAPIIVPGATPTRRIVPSSIRVPTDAR